MNTNLVDICYRPLRVGWVIQSGDIAAFRQAIRLSYALWGGQFNPILIGDHEEESSKLVELFRLDLLLPIGTSDEVKNFIKKFPHLNNPFYQDKPFIHDGGKTYSQLLDMRNALAFMHNKPEHKALNEKGFQIYTWQEDDPLADVFLMQFGSYPDPGEIGVDYLGLLKRTFDVTEFGIGQNSLIPVEASYHPCISSFARYAIQRHHSVRVGWDYPGFFVGDKSNFDDLVCFWNLKAADISLWFVDTSCLDRYEKIIPDWAKAVQSFIAVRHEKYRHLAVWSQCESDPKYFELSNYLRDINIQNDRQVPYKREWCDNGVIPPMMYFNKVSVLGILINEHGYPEVSFPLSDKPFCDDISFYGQHLVASVSFLGGLHGDEKHILNPPYIPELNEVYARKMNCEYNKFRIESERIGIIIDVLDADLRLKALPVSDLMKGIFNMVEYRPELSHGGLITRQLISRLGGLQGARIFKIPGVRRLLKMHALTDEFTQANALSVIGGKDPDNPDARFKDHRNLHLFRAEQLEQGLTAKVVFSYLVEKNLFRIGKKLTCSACQITSWIALDVLEQKVKCDLCGDEYDATKSLVADERWYYRRSGVLGIEHNVQGAIPVILTLQQLDANINGLNNGIYYPSINLMKGEQKDSKCEIDFIWITRRPYPGKTIIILGECKDQGPIESDEFRKAVDTLKHIADVFPSKRFEVFILISKLNAFTPDEINYAKTLNTENQQRVILLTNQELEPYHIYERVEGEKIYAGSAENLVRATQKIYFSPSSTQ